MYLGRLLKLAVITPPGNLYNFQAQDGVKKWATGGNEAAIGVLYRNFRVISSARYPLQHSDSTSVLIAALLARVSRSSHHAGPIEWQPYSVTATAIDNVAESCPARYNYR